MTKPLDDEPELDLAPETVEDLDDDDADVKGGARPPRTGVCTT